MRQIQPAATISYTGAADDENSAIDSINRSISEDGNRYQIMPDTSNSRPDEIGKKDITVAFRDWGGDNKTKETQNRGYAMTKTQKTEGMVNDWPYVDMPRLTPPTDMKHQT